MSPDPDFHEAADAWLDGTGSEGQGRILQEILHDKAAAAREFARISRAQAALELAPLSEAERIRRVALLLQSKPSSRFRRLLLHPAAKWSAAAAVIVLAALWWAGNFTKNPGDFTGPPAIKKAPNQLPAPAPLTPLAQLAPADAAYGKFMEAFIIPEFQAGGISPEEAIALLTDKVTAAGHDNFQVQIEESPADDATHAVHLHLKYQPASTLLQLIALQTGMTAYPTGKSYRLRRNPTPDSPSADSIVVSLERWDSFLESQGLEKASPAPRPEEGIIGHQSGRGSEPPAVATASVLPDLKSVGPVLQGTIHEAPLLVEPANQPGQGSNGKALRIGTSPKLHAMLELLLSGSAAPGTLTYDIKWANLPNQAALEQILSSLPDPKSIDRTGGRTLLGEPAVPALLEALLANSSIKLETNPPLLIAPGAAVTALDTASPDAAISDNTWIGRRCRITSKPSGSGIQCDLNIKYQTLREDGSIATTEQNSRFNMPVGLTLIQGGTKHEEGEEVMFFTPRLPEAFPYGIRIPGKPGFVRSPYAVEKGQVDVDGIPKNTKVKCPYTGKVFRIPE